MDPLSQASLGASLSQSFTNDRSKQLTALIIGALAGMAPDLDVFIRSADDPMLFLEFHRQFTHSLIFIPVGALLCALVFYPFVRKKLTFPHVYLFSFLAYATHGLLDACTSYGTQLFWPFSNTRIAWNTVSIIDPLFTLPIIVFIVLAVIKKNSRYARFGFAYAVIFLCLGVLQYQRAENALYELVKQRGHEVERTHIKPSFGNRHVWKLIYEYDGRYYVDAVKLLWHIDYIKGSSIQKLDIKRDFPWLPAGSQQTKDVERFRWFSDDFLAVNPSDANMIMDVRYSYLPNRINAMWGIELKKYSMDDDMKEKHVGYVMQNKLTDKIWRRFIEMIF
ncbi:MAG: metal-dependent hydrolase [Gammaproteobacteria bacterium]|nr:metal-dependent hydrolase [Gammaproteobacteria bacterium]